MEGEGTSKRQVRRKSNIGRTETLGGLRQVFPVGVVCIDILRKVADFVAAQRQVSVPVEPRCYFYAATPLDSYPVAVFDVRGQLLSDFTDFTGKD